MSRNPDSVDTHPVQRILAGATLGTSSGGIASIPSLARMLGAAQVVRVFPGSAPERLDAVVGWGQKPNTRHVREYAEAHGLPYLRLEDGFLRSVGLGVQGAPPLSVVVDDVGIHYDATGPSRLEEILEGTRPESALLDDPALIERARRCIDRIVEAHLSKYNNAPDASFLEPLEGCEGRVLVVDQTSGDLAVQLGMPHEDGFAGMVRAALEEHPRAEVAVKIHPDVLAGKKHGNLTELFSDPRVRIISARMTTMSLLVQVDHVYAMTSLMGFEALLAGKPLTLFGVPFYSGWGLSDDRVKVVRRTRSRSVEEVFAAAYLIYARYVDPETGGRCEIERVIDHLTLQREEGSRNSGVTYCLGFSPWKRGFVPDFLQGPDARCVFVRNAEAAVKKGLGPRDHLLVWGVDTPEAVATVAREKGVPVWHMEDGFLRSVGLGSDLVAPASLVIDRLGIYFDPTCPSELEEILETASFDDEEVSRAAWIREAMVEHGISKYNVGMKGKSALPPEAEGERVVLVVGQVEDDSSIQLGCVDVKTNEGLIRAAREARPDAFLVFKPHPDVVSGNRVGHVPPETVADVCDLVLDDVSIGEALMAADEVHTMTSLVGFESLLRGLDVVVYGLPFYAGWGLTDDRHSIDRRTRKLSLDELVAGTLIRYATYISAETHQFTTPEVILDQLRRELESRGEVLSVRSPWVIRQFRKGRNIYRGIRRGR